MIRSRPLHAFLLDRHVHPVLMALLITHQHLQLHILLPYMVCVNNDDIIMT